MAADKMADATLTSNQHRQPHGQGVDDQAKQVLCILIDLVSQFT